MADCPTTDIPEVLGRRPPAVRDLISTRRCAGCAGPAAGGAGGRYRSLPMMRPTHALSGATGMVGCLPIVVVVGAVVCAGGTLLVDLSIREVYASGSLGGCGWDCGVAEAGAVLLSRARRR